MVDDFIYDIKNDKHIICSLCECLDGLHVSFWKCPLLQGEYICSECCHVDALRNDIDKKFSEKLGTCITKDEINKQCNSCGKNHAIQDEMLAIELENKPVTKKENQDGK